jgi:eukaryotic-like serine/threonine-protein kinase
VPGSSCAELLRDRGRLDVEQGVEVVSQACRGLDYAHRNGVVHRDVKPGNLLVSEAEVVKLADFGIARATDQSSITQVGSVLGTAAYLAPEQARGEEAGPQADLYSLGVVTYQLLSGRLPYEATSLSELALKQQREAPPPLDHLNPDIPPELARAVSLALALDKVQRPRDAMVFAEALRAGSHGIARSPGDAPTSHLGTKAATRVLDRRGQPTAATRVAGREPPAQKPPATVPPRAASAPPREPARRREPVEQYPPPRGRRSGRAFRRFMLLLLVLGVFAAAVIVAVVIATGTSSTAVHFRNDVQGVLDQLQQLIHQYTK